MRTLKMLLGACVVAALLVADFRHQNGYGIPQPYRQFKYGDTWARVYLLTGRTLVLVRTRGWVEVRGSVLPPPDAGLGAFPPNRTPGLLTDPRRWCKPAGQVEPWCT
jgi:hypothetical protein